MSGLMPFVKSLRKGPLLMNAGFAYLLGPKNFLSAMAPEGSVSSLSKPSQLNLGKGLDAQTKMNFANIVNQKPMFKRASGGNMNHLTIAQKYREKRASLGGAASREGLGLLKNVLRPGMQTILYGLGAGMLGSHLHGKYQEGKQTQQAYTEMFERFPELSDVDPQRVDDYWGLMAQYAPSMTRNPLVAGQFIKNMDDYNLKGVDFPTLKSLLDIEVSSGRKEQDTLDLLVRGAGMRVD